MLCCVSLWFDGEEFAFSNFGLRWNKSVYILASSGRIDKYSSTPPLHRFISTFTNLFKRHSYSYLPDPDLHSYGTAIPTMHHSENDILFLHCSASFVKQPSLCWNYDSLSGMHCWVPWWHLFALLGDNNSNSAKRAGVLSGRSLPGVSHAAPEASPPFVRQGQGTKCWVIHIKLSGWKRLQMLLFLCLVLSPHSVFSLSLASCQRWLPGRLACEFLKSWKNVACEREVEALAPAPRELGFFFLCLYSQKYKVNSLK